MEKIFGLFLLFVLLFPSSANTQPVPVKQMARVMRQTAQVRVVAPAIPGPALRLPHAISLPAWKNDRIPAEAPCTQPSNWQKKWLTNHQRTIINVQRLVGVSKIQAIRNVRAWGAEYQAKTPRPLLLQEQSAVSADLQGLEPVLPDKNAYPPFPFQNQRNLIYRGLALDTDGAAIRNILTNGLRAKDSGPFSNTLLYTLAGPHSASRAIQAPIINLTADSNAAVKWATTRLSSGSIRVVVVVKSNLNSALITQSEDIPAQQIYAVTALLSIQGTPVWCKIELEGDNLRITPYK